MKLAIALISISWIFNFLSSASAVRDLDDSCAYCMTDENPSLTYYITDTMLMKKNKKIINAAWAVICLAVIVSMVAMYMPGLIGY